MENPFPETQAATEDWVRDDLLEAKVSPFPV